MNDRLIQVALLAFLVYQGTPRLTLRGVCWYAVVCVGAIGIAFVL